jgi:LPXTG-site transpeptidase (sortase) family protein
MARVVFRFLIAIYIGLAVFRLTDPNLRWFRPSNIPSLANAPTDIKIPKLNLDLAVSPSVIKGNEWQLFDDRVAWLSTSAIPTKGNTILYAHDRYGLFGDLYKLKVGDEVFVYAENWITYHITRIHSVIPSDVNSVFGNVNRLTLYTCEGTFDTKRLVVYAE